ncbi:hypothetical protein ABEY41_09495 [Peribacillus butanolivorans]|uniref:hypothetical protein n=1 Tax=Peribacillus butanolivorans TaxID=421767 RepID=UPI003D26AAA9
MMVLVQKSFIDASLMHFSMVSPGAWRWFFWRAIVANLSFPNLKILTQSGLKNVEAWHLIIETKVPFEVDKYGGNYSKSPMRISVFKHHHFYINFKLGRQSII